MCRLSTLFSSVFPSKLQFLLHATCVVKHSMYLPVLLHPNAEEANSQINLCHQQSLVWLQGRNIICMNAQQKSKVKLSPTKLRASISIFSFLIPLHVFPVMLSYSGI